MRAILGSYDSELTPAEHSPQLTRRMREAEDMMQKVQAHSSEVEVSAGGGACTPDADQEPRTGATPEMLTKSHAWGAAPESPAMPPQC